MLVHGFPPLCPCSGAHCTVMLGLSLAAESRGSSSWSAWFLVAVTSLTLAQALGYLGFSGYCL